MRGHAAGPLVAAVMTALLTALPHTGCAFAVDHPAVAAGIAGGTVGFGSCKLGGVDTPPCLGVGAGAAAFLALVVATATWLGGDGHTVMIEEQARPLPDDGRPIKRHRKRPAAEPAEPATPASEPPAAPAGPTPAAPPVPALPAPMPATSPSPAPAS